MSSTIGDDVFDSRDIIDRMAELEEMDERDELDEAELDALRALASDVEGYCADWEYGETFVLDRYFEDYAQELAEDIGAIQRDAPWPASYIDWAAAADALRQDYTSVDIEHDGTTYTYWYR